MSPFGLTVTISTTIAFALAAFLNYLLWVAVLFRHKARWKSMTDVLIYIVDMSLVGALDLTVTKLVILTGFKPNVSKMFATGFAFLLNSFG